MNSALRAGLMLACSILLISCAALSPYRETPVVTVTGFGMAPESESMGPVFRVGLRVINPNRVELPLVGMSYQVELQGQRVLSGAANELPVVPAYGSADFTVDLSPDLLGGIRLLSDLLSRPQDGLEYRFSARLDAGRWIPDIRVEEVGRLESGAY
ncbi:LEA type 2 family protein [Wenzhouxiangella marina]|uniref:Putative lipoprotein n=1 Tax=Wenzhouxiangella marina TaxID=1579979 RepID=A0A0K0XUH6_9GAMM|nr:LEA type 2 family protein [Wenzhouxiangella marina]AKS41338.1 Putative lipoprotein [Wenzhouxiangella marina]MBB6086912.1 hypothetical protein [Wenzhouxiangella marina]